MKQYLTVNDAYFLEYGMGLIFQSEEVKRKFIDDLTQELQVMVGKEISRGLTKEELAEFDLIEEPAEAGKWLNKHRPDYKDIVDNYNIKMKKAVWDAFGDIPGTVVTNIAVFRHMLASELDLSDEAKKKIADNNIMTIGELLVVMKNDYLFRQSNYKLYYEIKYAIEKYSKEMVSLIDKIKIIEEKDMEIVKYYE